MSKDFDNSPEHEAAEGPNRPTTDFTARELKRRGASASTPDLMRRHYCKQMLAALASPEARIEWVNAAEKSPGHYQLVTTIDDQALMRAYENDLETMVHQPQYMPEPRLERGVADALDTLRHYYGMNEAVIRHSRDHSRPLQMDIPIPMHADINPWLGITLTKAVKNTPDRKGKMLEVAVHLPHMGDIETRQPQWQRDLPRLHDSVNQGMLEIIEAANRNVDWTLPTGYGRA